MVRIVANVVIIEQEPDLFRGAHSLSFVTGHSIYRVSDCDEIISEPQLFPVVLLVINKTDNTPLSATFQKLARHHITTRVLVVVASPDMLELEYALKAGALDYIQRDKAVARLSSLLGRLDSLVPMDGASSSDVGKQFNILGDSAQMRSCLNTVATASLCDVSVLIEGETGTGKELFARAIHGLSSRQGENLIVVDCASLPANLVESMLFGYARGAFTGASTSSDGLVLRAHKGTLFLDEVSEIPMELQNKFLRVLQERRFRPVGGKHEVESDFRLVAATNKDLAQMVRDGKFRSDLLYRIRSLKLHLPPLRQRLEDLPKLTSHLLQKSCDKNRIPSKQFSKDFLDVLARHDWPGNVRELENVLDSVVALSHGHTTVHTEHLPHYIRVKVAASAVDRKYRQGGGEKRLLQAYGFDGESTFPSYKEYRAKALELLDAQYFRELHRAAGGDMATAMGMANLSRARLYEFYKMHNLTKAGSRS